MTIDDTALHDSCVEAWDGIVPVLHDYIAIPNVSPEFDAEWREHGHMADAVDLIVRLVSRS